MARRAVAKSQVLLKNRGATLPLSRRDGIYVAGSNANNIGNQAGGWTLTWQGGSTNEIPGTTILQAIRNASRSGRVTYSANASLPIRRSDIGVVVVGETPYAEGFGDVGGPLWAYDPGDNNVPRPVKDMKLSAADKAAVDKVCDQARRCVVIVVSGRPLIIDPAQRTEIDALVAAWLPGSEGDGVADTLYGAQAVHRQAADDVAAHARPGADQPRRRRLRPAVSVRLRPADPLRKGPAPARHRAGAGSRHGSIRLRRPGRPEGSTSLRACARRARAGACTPAGR